MFLFLAFLSKERFFILSQSFCTTLYSVKSFCWFDRNISKRQWKIYYNQNHCMLGKTQKCHWERTGNEKKEEGHQRWEEYGPRLSPHLKEKARARTLELPRRMQRGQKEENKADIVNVISLLFSYSFLILYYYEISVENYFIKWKYFPIFYNWICNSFCCDGKCPTARL